MQRQVNIKNKRARFEYELIHQYTAGIVLTGTEIKSIRSSKASIAESFCDFNDHGELFVINFERARLMRAGKASLADRIEQVSATEGPSAGFDIRSFEENGSDRFVEAKTTEYGMYTPFFVTPNELAFSRDNAANYHIYRLFHFGETPRFFTLSGYVADRCQLTPSEFVARAI